MVPNSLLFSIYSTIFDQIFKNPLIDLSYIISKTFVQISDVQLYPLPEYQIEYFLYFLGRIF